MTQLAGFGLFIIVAVFCLVIWPIMLLPSLPPKRKWLLCIIAFIVLVPGGIALYWWLGVPEMA